MSPEMWLLAAVAAVVLLWWAVLWWFIRKGTLEHADAALAPLLALSLDAARQRALALLEAGGPLEVSASHVDASSLPAGVPSAVRELFSRYESIGSGESWLDRRVIGPSRNHPEFLSIGFDSEFAEVLVRPGQEPVFTLTPTPAADLEKQSVPSAYHWVLVAAHDSVRAESSGGAEGRRTSE